ncbi:zf-DHHC-domain-containing protein [Decorospora gaudefroyi]|uniref:Palmitoyltransferase PFA4 n=1 Tax=Decorospora gaudefroyi TaxID=184978 RepID=A0A6A5KET0_9PLEO|nr:zf-DHHC-domain-containing protein [Decorospora gaudefroyi]
MEISQLAVPSVYILILFLGYPSQWLLTRLEPAPLTRNELIASNLILVLILITYTKSVFVDPGTIPKDWTEKHELRGTDEKEERGNGENAAAVKSTRKWCRKCEAAKPSRAHHCKECKRCIPKMDHHCPWTNNCVSHTTFPHFVRFLLYTTGGLSMLQAFLFTRLSHLWSNRDMPYYLGPSLFQLSHLFTVFITNTITLFVLGVLLLRNLWCLAVNTTTIEGWEIERHKTLLRRARQFGGYLESPDGQQVRIKKQEFPYDIGIWSNVVQGMGSANPLSWLNPLAATPSLKSGLRFQTNGFEDEGTMWPPPDPDRAYRRNAKAVNADAFVYENSNLDAEDTVAAFKVRQAEDLMRRRKPYIEQQQDEVVLGEVERDEYECVYGDDASDIEEEEFKKEEKSGDGQKEGEAAWRNSEGERLQDFGVDEDVEFYDEQEDDIPLSELIARRRAASHSYS